ncbi:uncharacterized protein K444DRAFT_544741 [Hyaloscypha bicolor E]|uniref:Myb-like domain-containing protein n=1 Tax=Hyaloscypha bicolor E TaxID=1095630 RepID=A0A2J6SKM8_9HELO|nr:uncharacterized protein K444DRAFT_544741 [Hyaloscypha bicolor E]PMD51315.1 hypothetical protein K444DRAFT_544741 [Hyaloscypha bicolor E]
MPKGQHRAVRSQGYYRLTPVTTPTTAYAPVSSRPDIQNGYYNSSVPLTPSMSQQSYTQQPSGYPNGGPVQLPLSTPQYTQMAQAPPLASIRPSSGAWNPQDDQTLMAARAQGMNWAPIQQAYFPSKTPNACRKRHERLMERRSADDWDGLKLESLAKNYMGMRREIWSGLAAETGEKWNVVEQKCMSQGLKNLQTAARSCARRERMLDTSQSGPYQGAYDRDDSGLGLGDDIGADYDGDGASDRSGSASAYQGHHYSSSAGSGGSGGYHPHGQRLPSMDMGIDAIINRPGNGR